MRLLVLVVLIPFQQKYDEKKEENDNDGGNGDHALDGEMGGDELRYASSRRSFGRKDTADFRPSCCTCNPYNT